MMYQKRSLALMGGGAAMLATGMLVNNLGWAEQEPGAEYLAAQQKRAAVTETIDPIEKSLVAALLAGKADEADLLTTHNGNADVIEAAQKTAAIKDAESTISQNTPGRKLLPNLGLLALGAAGGTTLFAGVAREVNTRLERFAAKSYRAYR